jgi:periplasmic copper chaperone A
MKYIVALVAFLLAGSPALAQVSVSNAWARATVAGQQASGAFMLLTADRDARLVEVSTPVAGIVEIHEMSMSGNVMKMRAVDAVELPAGKSVELKPGGYHVMLMDLKQPLKAGATIPLTLLIEGKDGKRQQLAVAAAVRAIGSPAPHGSHPAR